MVNTVEAPRGAKQLIEANNYSKQGIDKTFHDISLIQLHYCKGSIMPRFHLFIWICMPHCMQLVAGIKGYYYVRAFWVAGQTFGVNCLQKVIQKLSDFDRIKCRMEIFLAECFIQIMQKPILSCITLFGSTNSSRIASLTLK